MRNMLQNTISILIMAIKNKLKNKPQIEKKKEEEDMKPYGTLSLIGVATPKVIISKLAMQKMEAYVDIVNDEVGWLGTCSRVGNTITLEDVYLPRQRVHGATCEIDPNAIAELCEQFLAEPDGIEKVNSIRAWGHSHVRMTVTPSGQDEAQFKELYQNAEDYFIRIIANKNGDMKLDYVDLETGIQYNSIKWEVEEELLIDRKAIEAEIDEKVSEIVFQTVKPKVTGYSPIFREPLYSGNKQQDIYDDEAYWGRVYDQHPSNKQVDLTFDGEIMDCETTDDLEYLGFEESDFDAICNLSAWDVQKYVKECFVSTEIKYESARHILQICRDRKAGIR